MQKRGGFRRLLRGEGVVLHTTGTVVAGGVDERAQVNEGGAVQDGAGHLGRAMRDRHRDRERL